MQSMKLKCRQNYEQTVHEERNENTRGPLRVHVRILNSWPIRILSMQNDDKNPGKRN